MFSLDCGFLVTTAETKFCELALLLNSDKVCPLMRVFFSGFDFIVDFEVNICLFAEKTKDS